MATTTFVSGTLIESTWLNDVDAHAYDQAAAAHTAANIAVVDTAAYFTATEVEGVLAEMGADLAALNTEVDTLRTDLRIVEHIVTTTDATPTILTTDGGTATVSNTLVLLNSSAYTIEAIIIARDTSTGDVASWKVSGAAKRGANAAATALVGTPTETVFAMEAGASTWGIELIADTTLGAVEVRVTGEAATTIHWVCKFNTVEVS